MTEAEWLTSTNNPGVMLDQLRSRRVRSQSSDRKLRLISVACAQRIKHRVRETDHAIFTAATDLAERFAEGEASEAELQSFNPFTAPRARAAIIASHTCSVDSHQAAKRVVVSVGKYVGQRINIKHQDAKRVELHFQSDLIRCVLGNPFRPVAFDQSWLTSTAVAIAQGMYESRDFTAMPILADALQDAGCDNADILDHCRGAGPHVRGCWVIDQLLGKK